MQRCLGKQILDPREMFSDAICLFIFGGENSSMYSSQQPWKWMKLMLIENNGRGNEQELYV